MKCRFGCEYLAQGKREKERAAVANNLTRSCIHLERGPLEQSNFISEKTFLMLHTKKGCLPRPVVKRKKRLKNGWGPIDSW